MTLPDHLQDTLLEISRLDPLYRGGLEAAYRAITERAAEALDLDRVNVWFFDDDGEAIECVHSYDRREGGHGRGGRLSAEECPGYFSALREARQIAARDVHEDPRTAGFSESYSKPHGIDALLDAPVRVEGELRGVVCHESRDGPREWTAAERQFAASVGDFVARAVEARERKGMEEELRERSAFLANLISSSPGIIFRLDAGDLGPTYVSPNFEDATGHPKEAFLGDTAFWMEQIHPDDREAVIEEIRQGLEGETDEVTHEYRFRHADGEYRWYHGAAVVEREAGEPVALLGHALDITERKRAEESLRVSEERFRAVFEQNVAGAFQSTFSGELLRVNEAFASIFGFDDPDEMRELSASELYTSEGERQAYVEHLRAHGRAVNYEFEARRRDGSTLWLLENSVLVDDPEREEPTIVGTLIDISERKRLERELARMAYHDPLTGAANRRSLQQAGTQALALARRRDGRAALLYVDLVRFKQINDTLGHDAGDQVLVETASRLEGRVRESDTVARVGGDEFAVLLTELESAEDARRVAAELAELFVEPFDVADRQIRLKARVGVAVHPEHGETFEALLKAADQAMYRAPRAGTDAAVALHEPVLETGRAKGPAREEALRSALEADELVAHYQPILWTADGSLAGVEALARWEHPERGLVSAAEFVPLADRLGLLPRVDCRMAELALRQLERWPPSRVPWIAVNLSAQTLHDPNLVGHLEELLRSADLEEGRLFLEVTERTAVRDPRGVSTALGELRELGARVAIDDFGTGHAALAYLDYFPADHLKMDGVFLQHLDPDASGGNVAEAIVRLAEGLDLPVVAEWIEHEVQREWLRRIGCDMMQGFALGEPRPAEEMDLPEPAADRAG